MQISFFLRQTTYDYYVFAIFLSIQILTKKTKTDNTIKIIQINNRTDGICVPTLIGTQGCGKTTSLHRLFPLHLRQYYLDK